MNLLPQIELFPLSTFLLIYQFEYNHATNFQQEIYWALYVYFCEFLLQNIPVLIRF